MNKSIIVSEHLAIGGDAPCFIIAEAGINHNGSLETAKKMIDVAKDCGADAIKFQTFKAEEFISDKDEIYTYKSQGQEIHESMYEMFKRNEFTDKEWIEIARYCKSKEIIFFSTPQNPSDLDFLMSLVDMPIIKVGADDLTNLELIDYYASKQVPLIISAGMAYLNEIEDAVFKIREHHSDLVVLHCVSSYPAAATEVNLKKINTIKVAFEVEVGFSDHTVGIAGAIGAVALGAKVIEKHFTLDKGMNGPDHWFSAEPAELKSLVEGIRFIESALGSSQVKPTDKELMMRQLCRRSIVADEKIEVGQRILRNQLTFKRPGTGIEPKHIDSIIGRKAKVTINKNEVIQMKDLE